MPLPALLLRKNENAHKNDFGHLLVIAGSSAMLGAASLCTLAAMRCGAGLASVAVPRSMNSALQKKLSSVVMTLPLPQTRSGALAFSSYACLKRAWGRYQAMAIGPGLGRDPSTGKLARALVRYAPCPVVVDADALNALDDPGNILEKAAGPRVLTPHTGEFSRLTGLPVREIEKEREALAVIFARKWKGVLLLKGNRTVVADPRGQLYVNRTGNPGLATAGTGDVLTGMIGAFLAQGLTPFESARWGAFLHGKSADLAAKEIPRVSLIATDLIERIPAVFKKLV
jgi:NAD(P)H-hydrate epimerase